MPAGTLTNGLTYQFTATDAAKTSYPTYPFQVDVQRQPEQLADQMSGQLATVTDPVSGQSMTFGYGPTGCPAMPSGFLATPSGLLCQVTFWDGSQSALGYATTSSGGTQLGRVVDYPAAGAGSAQVTDFAYDGVGRLAHRAPLVAATAAAGYVGAGDTSLLTQISYDSQGRVATMAAPAAATGGTGASHTYAYTAGAGSTPWSTTVTNPALTTAAGALANVAFDPLSFLLTAIRDAAGRTTTNTWNAAQQLQSRLTGSGTQIALSYNADGLLSQAQGPTVGSVSATSPTVNFGYDETFTANPGGSGTPMQGLAVTYWNNAQLTGAPVAAELGPAVAGTPATSLLVKLAGQPTQDRYRRVGRPADRQGHDYGCGRLHLHPRLGEHAPIW